MFDTHYFYSIELFSIFIKVIFFFIRLQFDNMDPQQQFCLKWNSYSSNLAMTFSNLFKSDLLADVTLYCGGMYIYMKKKNVWQSIKKGENYEEEKKKHMEILWIDKCDMILYVFFRCCFFFFAAQVPCSRHTN